MYYNFTDSLIETYKNKLIENTEEEQDYEKVFEDENWTVYVPHTYQASMLLGKDTEWGIAGNNYGHKNDPEQAKQNFEYYYKWNEYPLYILINKKDPTDKYLFCKEEQEYFDKNETSMSRIGFWNDMALDAKLAKFFASVGIYFDDVYWILAEYDADIRWSF